MRERSNHYRELWPFALIRTGATIELQVPVICSVHSAKPQNIWINVWTLRPDNPAIRGYRAACLAWLDRYPEALQECNVALTGAPDLAELYRTRAFIRTASGQNDRPRR